MASKPKTKPEKPDPKIITDPNVPTATDSGELGFETIILPSRGYLYESRIPDGRVLQRKMLFAEDAILAEQTGTIIDRLSRILVATTKLPAGIKHSELLVSDRMWLMLTLRTLTHGPRYKVQFACEWCEKPNRNVPINIVKDLSEKVADKSLREPFTVKLPDAGKTVGLRFLRGSDEAAIIREQDDTTDRMTDTAQATVQNLTSAMAYRLVEIDGEPFENEFTKRDFIKKLSSSDAAAIRNATDDLEPGVDLRVFPLCRHCARKNEVSMPFTAEFFQPTSA